MKNNNLLIGLSLLGVGLGILLATFLPSGVLVCIEGALLAVAGFFVAKG